MCIGLPARVIAVDGPVVTVQDRGAPYPALDVEVGDLAVGDHVLVLSGMVVRRLTVEAAEDIAALLGGSTTGADVDAPARSGGHR